MNHGLCQDGGTSWNTLDRDQFVMVWMWILPYGPIVINGLMGPRKKWPARNGYLGL